MQNYIKLAKAIIKLAAVKGFVALRPDTASADKLFRHLKALGIKDLITPDNMHLTLMYDARPDIQAEYVISDANYTAEFDSISDMGTPGHDYYSIAVKFISPSITLRHKNLIAAGFESKYDNFVPHISLKYKPDKSDIAIIKANAKQIKTLCDSIKFGQEYTEEISDD